MKTNDAHIELPASKSISNRWLVINHLAGYPFVLRHLSDADDTKLLKHLLSQLDHGSSNLFYCHNAGTVARFMMAVLAITPGHWMLSGDERLKQRPMLPLINALRDMGCKIECAEKEGFLPVNITGYMPQHKMAQLDPTDSSQFVSAMLLIGPQLPNGLTLTLTDRASSRPYIDMTCSVLQQAGIQTSESPNRRVYRVSGNYAQARLKRPAIDIERDWSSASYIYAAAAIMPGVRLRMPGLALSNSLQGDRVVAQIFEQFGVRTQELRSPYRSKTRSIAIVGGSDHVSSFEYNFIDCPDLLPAVLVTCAALGVKARLKGVKNLRLKESDRLATLQEELKKMNGRMTITDTSVIIIPSPLNPTEPVCAHGDHRIAMAFAVLSLRYPQLEVLDPEIVSKSFPDFWVQLTQLHKAASQKPLSQE